VALAHSQVSLFEVDRELRFRWLQVPIAFGPTPDLGHTIDEITEESTALATILRQAIDSGRGVTSEVGVRKDGETRCLLASIEPLRDDRGDVIGAIGAATDISDTKRVQEELARALGFRDQMLGILGHDLRNPLSAVTGLTGLMLLDSALSEAARGRVEHIQEAARRMTEMIRTLIDFAQSRFKAGGLPVTPSPCDLGEIAAAAVADLRAAHHGCVIELAAPLCAAGHWDAGRMAQVVSNLVANAIAHGDRAAPVRVALDVGDEHVVLRVSNRGPMIPRELMPTLFEPFRQGSGGAAQSRGLGLGLYIVDQIVRGHGGTIAVDSTPEGTTFCVRVPRGG
jgi:signal transduction histidine kinase